MKITTLIPAYKPKYLSPLLRGLSQQSVRPDRVIISDDSPDRAFRKTLRAERTKPLIDRLNIEIIDGPQEGFQPNLRHLLKAWRAATPLLHIMLDDDILYPDFYKRHLAVHAGGDFSCSISRRWTALESGQPVDVLGAPLQVTRSPLREVPVNADLAFASSIPNCVNWFGEFSNMVYREDLYDAIHDSRLAGIPFSGLHDLGSVLCASLQKPVCVVNEHLGAFRINPTQITKQTFSQTIKEGHLAWIALALAGQRIGRLQPAQVAECCGIVGPMVLQQYAGEADMASFRGLVSALMASQAGAGDRFLEAWSSYAQSGS